MKFRMSTHFKTRFGEREVNFDLVKKTIRNPDYRENMPDGKTKATKKIDSEIVEVVYCKNPFKNKQQEYILITVYYKNL
ncbi:MAG: DUF4258 domain-containing protein [Patescibacteria group bacterium]